MKETSNQVKSTFQQTCCVEAIILQQMEMLLTMETSNYTIKLRGWLHKNILLTKPPPSPHLFFILKIKKSTMIHCFYVLTNLHFIYLCISNVPNKCLLTNCWVSRTLTYDVNLLLLDTLYVSLNVPNECPLSPNKGQVSFTTFLTILTFVGFGGEIGRIVVRFGHRHRILVQT